MKKLLFYITLHLISLSVSGQTCSILSKANNITPDKLCSPVTAVWSVSYTGVNNAGTRVSIIFDWDNGSVVTVPANETSHGVFEATASNIYTSAGDRCNYHPQAMLVVDGVTCTSSTQEQIVTVWDNDDNNGGEMHINPEIFPVCYGNSADVRFQDLTRFNCVPPQERDNPNVNTRWIQWIYGTDLRMEGTPVTIDGRRRSFEYYGDIVTLTGPVTGSGVWSDVIHVDDDKEIGDFFEVTLRNWNYCNPYDDPDIPGGPDDHENGDHPPVVTTAIILIVPYPDATINPVDTLCANDDPVTLTAHDDGGVWSGDGVTGNRFDPEIAGAGNHVVRYSITNADGCSDQDETIVTVMPVPDATITPVGTLCATDSIISLTAFDTSGVWSGMGVSGNTFDPSIHGPGNYDIYYTVIDENGCTSSDHIIINVATPDATINPLDTLCITAPPITLAAHDMGGIWSGPGVAGDKFFPDIAGSGDHIISYNLINPDCKDSDTAVITVVPYPDVMITGVGTVYINSPPLTLEASPLGGSFSGTGISGIVFDPAQAGLGTHIIHYVTFPDRYGCMGSDTIHIRVLMPPVPLAGFGPDTTGCSPLTVKFINTSEHGESYIWDFGDKVYSTAVNPEHTYYVAGNYIVRLIVNNISGQAVHSEIITVYQNPSAIFDAYPTEVINNEQIVVFYNYSQYGSAYTWRFGDGETSVEENPYHKYESPGTYNVSLTVVSEEGCIDSTVLDTPVEVQWKTGEISFPSVFKWNETGPTGGHWVEGVNPEMDFVFRPFFENVLEYRLQIFNRWGVLIYESHDLHKGWDGYFGDGNLALQGVYVWRATGQYADGEYFDLVGDVTFLH